MVICSGFDGRTTVVDGSSVAPNSAREDMFDLAPGGVGGMYGFIRSISARPGKSPTAVDTPGEGDV